MKRYFSLSLVKNILFLAVLVLLTFACSVEASPINSVSENLDTQEVVIEGKLDQAKEGQVVTLKVLYPDKSIDRMNSPANEPIETIINYAAQGKTAPDGSFRFSYVMEGDTGSYLFGIGSAKMSQPYVQAFTFYSKKDIYDALGAVNAADTNSKMENALTAGKAVLGIKYPPASVKKLDQFYQGLISIKTGHPFGRPSDFVKAYNETVVLQTMSDAENEGQISTLMQEYENVLLLKNECMYNTYLNVLSQEGKSAVRSEFINAGIRTLEDIRAYFNERVLVHQLFEAVGWTQVNGILSNANSMLNIDFSTYSRLSEKSEVDKKLLGRLFTSKTEIKNTFNDAVSEQYNIENRPTGGGGSSGGGGRTTTSASFDYPINNDNSATSMTSYFDDLESVPWAVESVNELAKAGIVVGPAPKTFEPNANITREQFIKMLMEAFKLVDESADASFEDVQRDQWYYKYVASAQRLQITNGGDDNTFGVGRHITRQEMVVLAYRVAVYAKMQLPAIHEDISFADGDQIDSYAGSSIEALAKAGIINGMDDNRFAPGDNTTRAEAAKILYSIIKLKDQ